MATGRRARVAAAAVGLAALVAGLAAAAGGGRTAVAVAAVHPDVPATAMDESARPAANSPALAEDPTDGRFVVLAHRLDAPDFGCALEVSGDGGRSWRGARPVPALRPGAEKCYAPEAAFDRAGRLYYLFVGLAGAGNRPMGAFLTSSTDRGRTFAAPRRVLGPLNFGVRMAVGAGGRLHLVWLHAGGDVVLGGFAG